MNEEKNKPEHQPNIVIDDHHYKAPKTDMSGTELKELGHVPANMKLFKRNPGPDPDDPIGDAEIVQLHDGDHFYSLPPGVVGRSLPSVEAELAAVKQEFTDAIVHWGSGTEFWVELPIVKVPTGKGWSHGATAILLPVPGNYPASRPPNFFVSPELTREGGFGGRGGPCTVAGKSWCPVCWSPQQPQETRRDLVACLRFAVSRFHEAK